MSDQNAQNQVGTPAEPQGSGQQPGTENQITPAPLFTQEQEAYLANFVTEHSRPVAQEIADTAFRGAQKSLVKIEQRVDAKMAELKTLGIQETPELRQKAAQQIEAEVMHENGQAATPPQTQQPPQQPQGQETGQNQQQQPASQPDNPAAAIYQELVQEIGVTLQDDDPELKSVDNNIKSLLVFQRQLETALKAKKERVDRANAINDPMNIPSAGQRTGVANPIANITDPDALYEMAARQSKR